MDRIIEKLYIIKIKSVEILDTLSWTIDGTVYGNPKGFVR